MKKGNQEQQTFSSLHCLPQTHTSLSHKPRHHTPHEDRASATGNMYRTENFVKFGHVAFVMCE